MTYLHSRYVILMNNMKTETQISQYERNWALYKIGGMLENLRYLRKVLVCTTEHTEDDFTIFYRINKDLKELQRRIINRNDTTT